MAVSKTLGHDDTSGFEFVKRTLGPAKHEKVARIGRILNVFRIAGAQSA